MTLLSPLRSVEDIFPIAVLLRLARAPDGQTLYLPIRRSEWKSRRHLNDLLPRLEDPGELNPLTIQKDSAKR